MTADNSQISLRGQLENSIPGFYQYGAPFRVWTNDYPRTVDSARLFTRGYLGPNSTALGTVYAINSTASFSIANSLATSDSCPTFEDSSGAGYTDVWDNVYLPPIASRLNSLIQENLNLTASDVSNFPYLCGFESQILRTVSPFCYVFTEQEILDYEYRQDLRYWYGTGLGAYQNASVQLPVLQGILDILTSRPNTTVKGGVNEDSVLGPLTVAFTQDNQINELASILGIFDEQAPLPLDRMDLNRIYYSSRITPMKGTITFERLNCDGDLYLRILLDDAVYPIPVCTSGPGESCPLSQYNSQILASKWAASGSFASLCHLNGTSEIPTTASNGAVTFFTDLTASGIRSIVP